MTVALDFEADLVAHLRAELLAAGFADAAVGLIRFRGQVEQHVPSSSIVG
jgi:hypothetical protein